MKGIIAMKDDDQCFVVQAVFSKVVRVRPITRIARLRIRTVSLLAPNGHAGQADDVCTC